MAVLEDGPLCYTSGKFYSGFQVTGCKRAILSWNIAATSHAAFVLLKYFDKGVHTAPLPKNDHCQ